MITKIISGGQTGADQAGLRAARQLGIQTGGWVPLGCRTDDGPAPWLVTEYGCREHHSRQYAPRTVLNIRDAQATVWFGDPTSPGGKLTLGVCESDDRPHVKIPYPCTPEQRTLALAALRLWFHPTVPIFAFEILNVAGNRERTNPGIGAFVEALLLEALRATKI